MSAMNRTGKAMSVGGADPEGFMKLTNEVLAHALLRMGLGLAFMAHGLSRIGILSAFAESVKGMFAKTGLPEMFVVTTAYAVPPVEFIDPSIYIDSRLPDLVPKITNLNSTTRK
jgi:hypothetical protein